MAAKSHAGKRFAAMHNAMAAGRDFRKRTNRAFFLVYKHIPDSSQRFIMIRYSRLYFDTGAAGLLHGKRLFLPYPLYASLCKHRTGGHVKELVFYR